MSDRKDIYPIGRASKLSNIPIKTLRYYDKIGLLVPEVRKDGSNYRYYTQKQILTLFIIRKLKRLGIPLMEIKKIIYDQDTAAMSQSIQTRLEEIRVNIEELNNQYTEAQVLLSRIAKGLTILPDDEHASWSTEEIKVEEIPQLDVIFTRRIKKNYKNSDVSVDRWFELFKLVEKHHLHAVGPVILTYHNDPLEQFFKADCDLEVSIQVNETRELPEFKRFGGFQAVTALHIGRNEEIIQSHIKTIRWLVKQGYTISGPISEEYLVSPVDINKEEDHITKIIIPVAREGQNERRRDGASAGFEGRAKRSRRDKNGATPSPQDTEME